MKMQDQSPEIRKNLITDTVTYVITVKENHARNIKIATTPSANVQSCNFSAPNYLLTYLLTYVLT